MKYQCDACKKVFLHPAKRMFTSVAPIPDPTKFQTTSAITKEDLNSVTTETHVCPYCDSINLTEYLESEPSITSVVSVDIADVDGKLKEGYIVHELYAKTATLVKKETEQEVK